MAQTQTSIAVAVVARTIFSMGCSLSDLRITAGTIVTSSAKDQLSQLRIFILKGWYGIPNGTTKKTPSIWKELDSEVSKDNNVDCLAGRFH